jgi:hypothetical protein
VKSSIGAGTASAVSDNGAAVAGQNGDRGWRWTQGTGQVTLPLLPGATFNYNPAIGISGDGRYVVGQGAAVSGLRAYRYDATANTIAALGASIPTNPTDAGYASTADGQIVTGSANGNLGRWVDGVLSTVANNRSPRAITDNGATIVGDYTGIDAAFIWDADHGARASSSWRCRPTTTSAPR